MSIIDSHINEIKKLCVENKVKTLYAFGSVLTSQFNNQSDIDLLVDFEIVDLNFYADHYFNLKFGLEKLLKRDIDLLEQKALKNPYFVHKLNHQKQLIYGY